MAAVLFTLLKKVVKFALFVGLIIIVFLVITSIIYPGENIFQKGKDYILGKTGSALEAGKDKVTAYVITGTNESLNKAKEKVFEVIELD